ncbi:MAG: Ig-like domain-containing protein, partial [Planctomycetes bacterium]|nr:Ig-like domain-containing protein [Planctomycetota bacterium]
MRAEPGILQKSRPALRAKVRSRHSVPSGATIPSPVSASIRCLTATCPQAVTFLWLKSKTRYPLAGRRDEWLPPCNVLDKTLIDSGAKLYASPSPSGRGPVFQNHAPQRLGGDLMDRSRPSRRRRRRAVRAVLLAWVASTCLPTEPEGPITVDFTVPDTLLAAIAQSVKPTIEVRADGQLVANARITLTSADQNVAAIDTADNIVAVGRGVVPITVTFITAASGDTPADTTFPVKVIVAAMRQTPVDTTLTAIGDTIFFRPGYLDANGDALAGTDSASITPAYALLSSGNALVLNAATGVVVSKAVGSDTLRATVDTSHVDLVVNVTQVADSVVISPDTVQLAALDETVQLAVSAWDSRATSIPDPVVTWGVLDSAIVSIDASGVVTALANGATQIIATVDDISDTVGVGVQQIVAGLSVDPDTASISIGSTIQLSATAVDANQNEVPDGEQVNWESVAPSIASVDGAGLVTGVSSGDVYIRATANSLADSALITVFAVADSIDLTPDNVLLTALGETQQFTAEAFDVNGDPIPAKPITWTSDDEGVATVDANGLVTAVANGTTNINASADAVTESATVQVAQAVDVVTVDPETLDITIGDTGQLTISILDANGFDVVGAVPTMSSSDSSVAVPDATGLVTGIGQGSAVITASASGKSDFAPGNVT